MGRHAKVKVLFSDYKDIISTLCTCAGVIISVSALILNIQQIGKANEVQLKTDLVEQAKNISGWITGGKSDKYYDYTVCTISNTSNTPIYDVVITVTNVNSSNIPISGKTLWDQYNRRPQNGMADEPGIERSLFPCGQYSISIPYVNSIPGSRSALEIGFRDSRGNSWIINAIGYLNPIYCDPLDYYKIPKPISGDFPITKIES